MRLLAALLLVALPLLGQDRISLENRVSPAPNGPQYGIPYAATTAGFAWLNAGTANCVVAGPPSGGAAAPTCRALGWADVSGLAGATASTFAVGNDARLSDARTPTAHAATHQNSGSDEVATATPGANAIPKAGAGGTLAAGWIPTLNQSTSGTAANLSGTPALPNGTTATTQSPADASTKLATTAYVDTGLGLNAPIASPSFTGQALFADGTAAAPGVAFASYPGLGLRPSAPNILGLYASGALVGQFYSAGLAMGIGQTIAWGGDTAISRAYAGTPKISVGTGTATANIGGTYAKFVSGTGVGNGANTTNDPLWTLTPIPANTFTANGDALVLTLGIGLGATANNKAVGCTVGGTQVTGSLISYNGWGGIVTVTITRVDSTHLNVFMGGTLGNQVVFITSLNLAVADVTTNTLAVVVTGASPTTGAAGDVKLFSGLADLKK
jgi:hypothetical protein